MSNLCFKVKELRESQTQLSKMSILGGESQGKVTNQ